MPSFARLVAPLLLFSSASLIAAPARADAQESPSTGSPEPESVPGADLHFLGSLGGFGGGLAAALDLLARWRVVEAGLVVQESAAILEYSATSVGIAGGLGLRPLPGLRLEALGVAGADVYRGVSAGLFSDDPGANGTVPFAGVRGGIAVLFGPWDHSHFELGAHVFYDHDLATKEVAYTYSQHPWFGGAATPVSVVHTLGTSRSGALIGMGCAFDL